jgi:hypothetical protein
MIKIYGEMLSKYERKFLRKAAIYTIDHLVSRRSRKNSNIIIKIEKIQKKKGEMDYSGIMHSNKKRDDNRIQFDITLDSRLINKRAKRIFFKFKDVLELMCHELIHVKQEIKNEIYTYVNNDVRYMGQRFSKELVDSEDEDIYYNLPWEIEAYDKQLQLLDRLKSKFMREENERSS